MTAITANTTESPTAQPVIRSLEGKYYPSPEIFAAEQAGLLMRTWQFVGHASALEKSGDYFAFEMSGERLFCLRDKDGEVRTFYNVCQHRAHELVSGSGNASVVVCPYHSWTYALNGQLRAGPNIRSVPDFPKSEICLTSVRTEVFHGFIFVNLDPVLLLTLWRLPAAVSVRNARRERH